MFRFWFMIMLSGIVEEYHIIENQCKQRYVSKCYLTTDDINKTQEVA
jgi:hypothetical protein